MYPEIKWCLISYIFIFNIYYVYVLYVCESMYLRIYIIPYVGSCFLSCLRWDIWLNKALGIHLPLPSISTNVFWDYNSFPSFPWILRIKVWSSHLLFKAEDTKTLRCETTSPNSAFNDWSIQADMKRIMIWKVMWMLHWNNK